MKHWAEPDSLASRTGPATWERKAGRLTSITHTLCAWLVHTGHREDKSGHLHVGQHAASTTLRGGL